MTAALAITLSLLAPLPRPLRHVLGPLDRLAHPSAGMARDGPFSSHGWVYSVTRDRFTGQVRCRLDRRFWPTGRSIGYTRDALAFRVGSSVNTLEAWYRIDGGPARPWQRLYPTLVERGLEVESGPLDNPTGGTVLLPISELIGAHEVTIRTAPGARPAQFDVRGFSEALLSARARGCVPDDVFSG